MKKTLGIAIFALTLTTMAGCAVRSYSRYGPPSPPREGMLVRTHDGLVWVPAYDRWTGNAYRHQEGRWERPPRRGMAWVPGYRAPRRGGYVWVEGHWR